MYYVNRLMLNCSRVKEHVILNGNSFHRACNLLYKERENFTCAKQFGAARIKRTLEPRTLEVITDIRLKMTVYNTLNHGHYS